mmetsp:Transcript_12060/g.19208  ORF Transcript_12060/g.19208 Transcript_12060/m.19208 type:complete len:223 (-) Transcript_12060:312-980(-)|eukprot:CAMPEP_0203777112 /NCGR_PEP_ID=MMETSP0099_2-20121227/7188_1 /ASSEMBLY_ACC=CAM_ASM_000209 /TAXON_ID=96639 /ORGANISM=" , Strain NY0313808BC1" /LENGTH=222 /DNA_ID=CAMNT_0050676329 /DNA_START=45 /DNA_END=713 /DNA_ORIENTATION=+
MSYKLFDRRRSRNVGGNEKDHLRVVQPADKVMVNRCSSDSVETIDCDEQERVDRLAEAVDDFETIFFDSHLKELFREFLKHRFAEENLLFYERVIEYEDMENDEGLRHKTGSDIVVNFVLMNSKMGVNLSSDVRLKILDTYTFEKDTFFEARMEVFNLMRDNFFARFAENPNWEPLAPPKKLQFRRATSHTPLKETETGQASSRGIQLVKRYSTLGFGSSEK